ncbi:MAG: DUF3540 domain-containing protein [Deltaproteobacteria bacterium]|jgi:hypothetical protein|nr:DUF3540 domain-containing protein [Deltaproteobacteria bacterium]
MPQVLESIQFSLDISGSLKRVLIAEAFDNCYLAHFEDDGYEDNSYEDKVGLAIYRAKLAPSCLLVPQKGDLALAFVDRELVYILAILERDAARGATIALPDEAMIAGRTLTLKPEVLALTAPVTNIQADQLRAEGRIFRLDFQIVHFLAGLVSSVCRSVLTTAKNLALRVSGSANVSSQTLLISAAEDLRARAGGVDLRAEGSVQIDGRDIKLG